MDGETQYIQFTLLTVSAQINTSHECGPLSSSLHSVCGKSSENIIKVLFTKKLNLLKHKYSYSVFVSMFVLVIISSAVFIVFLG